MAILHKRMIAYIRAMLERAQSTGDEVWRCDPLFTLWLSDHDRRHLGLTVHDFFKGRAAAGIASAACLAHALSFAFPEGLLISDIDAQTERRIVALKLGFPQMPATTAATILKGFGSRHDVHEVAAAYASYGQSRDTKPLSEKHDFGDINRRVSRMVEVIHNDDSPVSRNLTLRCELILKWLLAPRGRRESILANMPIKRGNFFYWWKSFTRLGVLGLVEPGLELFRKSKIGPDNEARLVIDKLQHPERPYSFYVQRLRSMGIRVKSDTVAKVFSKWRVNEYSSAFVSNLEHLDSLPPQAEPYKEMQPVSKLVRKADMNFIHLWHGLQKHSLNISSPGLFALWAYIEELGILPQLEAMGLTKPPERGKYAWCDCLLFDIARRFFGISTLSAACEAEIPELAYFAHLFRAPCNDTLLNGLSAITQEQTMQLRQWLVQRLASLGLATGKQLAFDFHQIDQDVKFSSLRQFGSGPSPKKKCCYTGFRPHIAWDIDQGTLLVAEFRKASARGTTTIRRFIADHILPTFKNLFDTVYIDSEYTGKDVWNFILDKDKGMRAHLVACLKQNALVRKARDQLLSNNIGQKDFWRYYDDDHVYAAKTFNLKWEYTHPQSNKVTILKLRCAVKKHVRTGKLRCFGSSKLNLSAPEIFAEYSHRWTIEVAIKDLVHSYFMDKCPGENPHAVDVHLLVMTICRTLYRMLERDAGDLVKNSDATTKTLARMRDILFRQGTGTLGIENNTLVISLDKPYLPKRTSMLRAWFDAIETRYRDGLEILGGLVPCFKLQPALGPEFKNSGKKLPLTTMKISKLKPQEGSFS